MKPSHLSFACLYGLIVASACLGSAWAENHALLIGVSNYPGLAADLQLDGPVNDVQLMREVLKTNRFEEANIRVLAETGEHVDGLPTRAAIFDSMKSLAEKAKEGDFVYLLFGGHGTQQPTRPNKVPTEMDGLDELFLPRDVGTWNGAAGKITNALVDEEIGRAITAIRARGAFVWAVFDSCHSGNVTRSGAPKGLRERKIGPLQLGVPQKALDEAANQAKRDASKSKGTDKEKAGAIAGGEEKDGYGGFVYFYAAQSNETAPEMDLPAGGVDRKPYGFFTFSLAQVITSNPGISYRQASERVLQLYAAANLRSPTPLFEGSGMDAPLFGQKAGDTVRQWKIVAKDERFDIAVGALHQFDKGTIFAVVKDAAAKDSEVVGYMRADDVGVTSSKLVAVALNDLPVLTAMTLPKDAVVRMVDPAINLQLSVSLPAQKITGTLEKVLRNMRDMPTAGLKVRWVDASQPADLRLELADNKLWLLPSDGAWIKKGEVKTPSITLDKSEQELQGIFASTLQRIAKVTNLARLAAQMQSGAIGSKLSMKLLVTRAKTGKKDEISAGTVPNLEAGDKLQLLIHNRNRKAVDITVLAVDSLYGITALFPLPGEANRINSGSTLALPADNEIPIEMDGKTSGQESFMIVAVEEQPYSTMTNVSFLEQDGLMRVRGQADAATTFESVFADAGDGGQRSRGPERKAVLGSTAIQVFRYRAVPLPQPKMTVVNPRLRPL